MNLSKLGDMGQGQGRTGKPGILQSMGVAKSWIRVETEQQQCSDLVRMPLGGHPAFAGIYLSSTFCDKIQFLRQFLHFDKA